MKKFLVFMLAMLWMSVAAFSQITISQEDYDKLPSDTRTQIEKITTEKAIKAVKDSAIRISESRTNSDNYCSMEITI